MALGFFLGLFVRLWIATLRVRVFGQLPPRPSRRPCVFAFWHGQQMLLAAAAPRPMATLVSWSRDGALQSGVMRALGIRVVRGSSSRGGAAGLLGLLRAMDTGCHAAFAADGPRGPVHRPKPGPAAAARRAGVDLVPVGAAAARAVVLGRAWDRFEIPLPFSHVVIVLGPALDAVALGGDSEPVAAGIDAARAVAREGLACATQRQRVAAGQMSPGKPLERATSRC